MPSGISAVTDMLLSPLTFVVRWVGCPKGPFLLTFHACRMDLRADDAAHRLTPQDRDPVSGLADWIEQSLHDLPNGEGQASGRDMGLGNVAASYLQSGALPVTSGQRVKPRGRRGSDPALDC